MQSTGIVRKAGELGRITLPKELRDIFDININDPLEIYVQGERIILKKYQPSCVFCGNADNTSHFKGKMICSNCASEGKETDTV